MEHTPKIPYKPNIHEALDFYKKLEMMQELGPCSATCLGLTCKEFYRIYSTFGGAVVPVRLNHVVALKAQRRGMLEVTYITLHYLLKDFMVPNWIWDPDFGIFRPKEKAGTVMSDDEFQEWLEFNRSRGRERGRGWRGMGGKIVVRCGTIFKTFE